MADLKGEMNTQNSAVSMKPPSSIISTTKTAVEQAVESTSAGTASSDGPASTLYTSAMSEISQDDSQHRTESSCSNSFKSYGAPTGNLHAAGAIGKILVSSSNPENLNCSSEKEENIRSYNEHLTSHSAERTISSEISGESENISKLGPEMIKSSEDSLKERNLFVAGFDLNEDINGDDYTIQPVAQTLSSHSVIHVLAKAAVPRGLPMKPLKFEGGLGWNGSAETSAFRATVLNYSQKSPQCLMGFDLNVAAGEDCASDGFLDSSSLEVGLRKTEGLGFDLNCLYDATDQFPKPSRRQSRIPPLMDSNLNSDSEIQVKREAYFMVAPNSLQQLELMQRFSPFQPKLPPQSYMSKAPFHFRATDPLPPHLEHPKENGVLMNPRMFHSVGPPYFVQVVHGHSNSAVSTPKVEEYLQRSGSKMEEARQLFFLSNYNSQTEEQVNSLQQEVWYATSAKRKEPEGGMEYHQLGYRC